MQECSFGGVRDLTWRDRGQELRSRDVSGHDRTGKLQAVACRQLRLDDRRDVIDALRRGYVSAQFQRDVVPCVPAWLVCRCQWFGVADALRDRILSAGCRSDVLPGGTDGTLCRGAWLLRSDRMRPGLIPGRD